MKKRFIKIIHKLWDKLPEGNYKEQARVFQRNYFARNTRATFSVQNGVFSVEVDGVQFHTIDHPFGVAHEHYQEKYKLREGDICIDAGAYNGHLSLLFSLKVGSSGHVIAVEPDDKNFGLIKRNLHLNGSIHNITIINNLLWSSNKKVEFSELGTVGSSVFYKPVGKPVISKDTITIDDLVETHNLPRMDLIKMDIEGAELEALNGAVNCIKKYRPNFAIASYHIIDNTPTRFVVEQFLKQYDYIVETIFYGAECVTYASR